MSVTTVRANRQHRPTAAKAVVLLSGGLDSAVNLAEAQHLGHEVHAISLDYGQRHRIELEAAQLVAKTADVAHHTTVTIDLRIFGGSALTDATIDVPRHASTAEDHTQPATYVPARNTIFLSYALAYAETIGANHIFIGVNAQDRDGYPDCRPAYIAAYQQMANLATRNNSYTIHTPLADLSKAATIRRGITLGVNLAETWSCYNPTNSRPCRTCDACHLRADGFAKAGIVDPAVTP